MGKCRTFVFQFSFFYFSLSPLLPFYFSAFCCSSFLLLFCLLFCVFLCLCFPRVFFLFVFAVLFFFDILLLLCLFVLKYCAFLPSCFSLVFVWSTSLRFLRFYVFCCFASLLLFLFSLVFRFCWLPCSFVFLQLQLQLHYNKINKNKNQQQQQQEQQQQQQQQ